MRFLPLVLGLWIVLVVGSVQAEEAAKADPPASNESAAPTEAVAEPQAGAPVRPEIVTDPGHVSVAHVHIVFERKGHFIGVTQTLRLTVAAGQIFRNTEGYSIPLPTGSQAARPVGENKDPYRILLDRIVYLEPIGAEGREVTIAYNLPIRDGRLELNQRFAVPVRSAQLISTWTKNQPVLEGAGFGEPRMLELNSGLMALVMNGGELADGQIRIVFQALGSPEGELEQLLTLIASLALLALGVVFWVRNYLRGKS